MNFVSSDRFWYYRRWTLGVLVNYPKICLVFYVLIVNLTTLSAAPVTQRRMMVWLMKTNIKKDEPGRQWPKLGHYFGICLERLRNTKPWQTVSKLKFEPRASRTWMRGTGKFEWFMYRLATLNKIWGQWVAMAEDSWNYVRYVTSINEFTRDTSMRGHWTVKLIRTGGVMKTTSLNTSQSWHHALPTWVCMYISIHSSK